MTLLHLVDRLMERQLERGAADMVQHDDRLVGRATAAGLAATGVETNGDAFAFSIDTARYDAVIAFIAALEGADGAVIRSLRIEGAGQPGLVRVRMQVSRP